MKANFTSMEVCQSADITYRQLDFWCRSGVFGIRHRQSLGSGSRRTFTADEVRLARYCGAMSAALIGASGRSSLADRSVDLARQLEGGATSVRLELAPGVHLTIDPSLVDDEAAA